MPLRTLVTYELECDACEWLYAADGEYETAERLLDQALSDDWIIARTKGGQARVLCDSCARQRDHTAAEPSA